jgi:cyclic pyranopterin phosphate synthase
VNAFNHFDAAGNAVMVDVSAKDITVREACASGFISLKTETLALIKSGTAAKGDVLGAARIAGIMAAKKTSSLIPLCHTLALDKCSIDFELQDGGNGAKAGTAAVKAFCRVKTTGKTGAEMEALTGVTVALLTVYDMCKAVDRAMTLSEIQLEEKSGGKSGIWKRG